MDSTLRAIPDGELFEEVAKRLKDIFESTHRKKFSIGRFEFIFHNGAFRAIESWSKAKCYVSPDSSVDTSEPDNIARIKW